MSGQALYFVLSGQMSLMDAIEKKARRAAETGEFFVPVFELVHSYQGGEANKEQHLVSSAGH
jgi:hypothetical protein